MKRFFNKTGLIFYFLFCFFISMGQNEGFEFVFSTTDDELVKDIAEDNNGNYYFACTSRNPKVPDYDSAVGLLIKLNSFGELIDSAEIQITGKSYSLFSIVSISQDTFLLNGIAYNPLIPNYYSSIVLSKMDDSLNLFKINSFDFADSLGIGRTSASITYDNEIFLSGNIKNGFESTVYNGLLGRFSIDLDSLRVKLFLEGSLHLPYSRKLTDGRYFVIGFGWTNYLPRYMIFDSIFNFIEEARIPPTDYFNNPFGAKWDTDTSFYLTTHWVENQEDDIGVTHQISINNFDDYDYSTWGTIDTMDFPALYHGIDFKTKDSIFVGGTTNFEFSYFAEIPSWYFVIQTDSLLNVRWERFYGGDAHYVMTKILATNDGGCLLAGAKYDYKNTDKLERDIYILKLNSEGLLVGNSETPTIKMKEAIVFPNPGSNRLRVRVAAQYINSTFELYDMAGNRVISQNITGRWGEINTAFLPAGNYVYRIFNDKGLFETGKWVKQ